MRLYKMELYKLCHRKIFMVGIGFVVGILLIFFQLRLADERSYVDGTTYLGYRAVQVDREITEEFQGVITDEKAEKIIEKYGFPQKVEDGYWYYQDANFLNTWIEKYLSNGYYLRWSDYEIATDIYPIADTELGEVIELTGKDIVLEYSDGWLNFTEVLEIGLVLGSILILFGISVVFAGEGQTKMLPLLFTTKEGSQKDIYAKIAAAFTVGVGVWLGIVVLDLLLCGSVYGFSGLECLVGVSKGYSNINAYRAVTMLSIASFIIIVLVRSLIGILLLCAMTICVSAYFKSSFHAIVVAAICFALPILIWILMPGIYSFLRRVIILLVYASPLYMVMYNSLFDCYEAWCVLAGISVLAFMLFTVRAYRKYKGQQAE